MERKEFWILILLGIAVGASLEIMKTPLQTPVRLAGFNKFETILEEGRPVASVEDREADEVAKKILAAKPVVSEEVAPKSEIIVAAAEPTATPQPTPKAETPEEIAKKKAEEEKKKKQEKKKKEKEKDKRKKEREEKIAKFREEIERQRTEKEKSDKKQKEERERAENEAVLANSGPQAKPTPALTGATVSKAPKVPQTAREWEALLLKEVNPSMALQFVKYYQSGQVKPEIYFSVIKQMSQDNRPKMRDLGIKAAVSTPEARALAILVQNSQAESDVTIKARSTAAVQSYSRYENLKYLMAVLMVGDATDTQTSQAALDLLKTSVDTNLRANLSASSSATNSATTSSAVQTSTLVRAYSPFIQALQTFAQKNPSFAPSASQLATDLQNTIAQANH